MIGIEFLPINTQGRIDNYKEPMSDLMYEIGDMYAQMASSQPYEDPWIGYFARLQGTKDIVGTCGFKGRPSDSRVEIAYFTFPGHEGKGYASIMARKLVILTENTNPLLTVVAHTLPEQNASTKILRNIGFQKTADTVDPIDGPVWEWTLDLRRRG